jgi:hypothetical protein
MLFDWSRSAFRTALAKGAALCEAWSKRQVAAFCKDRSWQSDDQFLEACERFGPERWPDAFGCFRLAIRCHRCGRQTDQWVIAETA